MKTAVIAVSRNGVEVAGRLMAPLEADLFVKNDSFDKVILNGKMALVHPFAVSFPSMVEKLFSSYDALIFIMACGIAVRSIAPLIKDKQRDPAVVVVDELGRFAISLLSGHIGGANRLAGRVAALLNGTPVITTATDIHGVAAFDMLAADNDCAIENISELKHISAELVNGGSVCLFHDLKLNGVLPGNIVPYRPGMESRAAVVLSNSSQVSVKAEKILYLRPRNLLLGIGCKKGKSKQEIERAVELFLEQNNKSLLSVRCAASIDLKAREQGILEFCGDRKIPFRTLAAEKIRLVEHQFASSDYVRKVTGVGCVAEACAVLAGDNARLICRKTVYQGITLALAEEERVFTI